MKHQYLYPLACLLTVLLLPATVSGDSLCANQDCELRILFTQGGSINSDQPVNVTFGEGGAFSLGDGGSLILGEDASLNGVTLEHLNEGGSVVPNSEIILDSNSQILFGAGGELALGLGGNIRYETGTIVNVAGASTITITSAISSAKTSDIASDTNSSVAINSISSNGSVNLSATQQIEFGTPTPSLGGVQLNTPDALSEININAGTIHVENIFSASQLNLSAETIVIEPSPDDLSDGGEDIDCPPAPGATLTLASTTQTLNTQIECEVIVGETDTIHTDGTVPGLPDIVFNDETAVVIGQPIDPPDVEPVLDDVEQPESADGSPEPFTTNSLTDNGGGGMTWGLTLAVLACFVKRRRSTLRALNRVLSTR